MTTGRESLIGDRSSGSPQMPYAFVATSDWGQGDDVAEFSVGDVIYVPADAPCVIGSRCESGLHRVESCFSIDEGPSFYYRLSPARIVGSKGALRVVTDWNRCSDRLHVIPGTADYTVGWVRLHHEVAA